MKKLDVYTPVEVDSENALDDTVLLKLTRVPGGIALRSMSPGGKVRSHLAFVQFDPGTAENEPSLVITKASGGISDKDPFTRVRFYE